MQITFYGACKEVTGSMHLISANDSRILLDCGMFQGKRKEAFIKNRSYPFEPSLVSNIVLSHSHIDHSGRIPLLSASGFAGRIISTRPTKDACEYMLLDSAHIQESDAEYLNYKTARRFLYEVASSGKGDKSLTNKKIREIKKILRKDRWYLNKVKINEIIDKQNLNRIEPLYTVSEAEQAITQFEGYPHKYPVEIGSNIRCTFYNAGHILGSAITIVEIVENSKKFNICYTGDLGRFNKVILRDPALKFDESHNEINLLIMESTYGDRIHGNTENIEQKLEEVVTKTYQRGGSIIIPSFAMERAQEIIYFLHKLYNEKRIPEIPIYVNSPLTFNLTRVFAEHPECYDRETHRDFLENSKNPFTFKQLKYIQTVKESMKLTQNNNPHIVISASGMCESGRILHHLRYKIHNSKNTILIVGFMAENTLGRRILELGSQNNENNQEPPLLKILGKEYPLNAEVAVINEFSAHADRDELIYFLKKSNLKVKKIAVVHGEKKPSQSFSECLNTLGYDSFVPDMGFSMIL